MSDEHHHHDHAHEPAAPVTAEDAGSQALAEALGRFGQTMTGCLRPGVTTWLVGEAIVYEIVGAKASRVKDAKSGFALLEPR